MPTTAPHLLTAVSQGTVFPLLTLPGEIEDAVDAVLGGKYPSTDRFPELAGTLGSGVGVVTAAYRGWHLPDDRVFSDLLRRADSLHSPPRDLEPLIQWMRSVAELINAVLAHVAPEPPPEIPP
ncbi:hypothetical protein [Streptomyces sp. NPDC002690]